MEELKRVIVKFQKERDWEQFHSPENLAKSISIEAGELLELFQWNNDFNKDEVADELADVLNYCILMAYELDLDIDEIVLNKMKKTAKNILLRNVMAFQRNITNYNIGT